MKVNRESWLIKWAYLLKIQSDEGVPYNTSVCALFWRCVVVTPIHVIIFLATLFGFGFMLAYPWMIYSFHNVLAVWTGFAMLFVLIAGIATKEDDPYTSGGELNFIGVIAGHYDAVHTKVCPIVTIERR
ncbi:MAG: hypothetical protein V3V32_05430 [Dehalococcoidia bacterium]